MGKVGTLGWEMPPWPPCGEIRLQIAWRRGIGVGVANVIFHKGGTTLGSYKNPAVALEGR